LENELPEEQGSAFEVSYFQTATMTHLLTQNVPISLHPTGYASTTLNAAYMTNKGVEALFEHQPRSRAGIFGWDITLNYTRIRNKVTKINGGTQQLSIGQTWAFVGMALWCLFIMSVMCGTRAPHQILVDKNRSAPLPVAPTKSLATCRADYLAGMTNTFYL